MSPEHHGTKAGTEKWGKATIPEDGSGLTALDKWAHCEEKRKDAKNAEEAKKHPEGLPKRHFITKYATQTCCGGDVEWEVDTWFKGTRQMDGGKKGKGWNDKWESSEIAELAKDHTASFQGLKMHRRKSQDHLA